MTTEELINYYANLLILQYLGKPKAYATIQTLVTPVVMDQLPIQVQNAFNLLGDDTAVGVQLDVLGKYAGVVRAGYTFTGPIILDDPDFLTLIKIAIARNSAGSSLSEIQNFIQLFFPGQILVFDYQNMQMSYLIDSSVGSVGLIQLFILQGMLPKPMGVQIAAVIYAPVINMFFGFRTYLLPAFNSTPFNTYADYQLDWPWLSYSNTPAGGLTPMNFDIDIGGGDVLITEGGDEILATVFV